MRGIAVVEFHTMQILLQCIYRISLCYTKNPSIVQVIFAENWLKKSPYDYLCNMQKFIKLTLIWVKYLNGFSLGFRSLYLKGALRRGHREGGPTGFSKISKCHFLRDIEKSFQKVTSIGPEPHHFFLFRISQQIRLREVSKFWLK